MLILLSQGLEPPKIFYRNSKHEHLKLPPLIAYLLEKKLKVNGIEENKENIIGGILTLSDIIQEQDFTNMESIQQNEGGWWALFRTFLIIYSKSDDYFKRMVSWTPPFYAVQKHFKEVQIDLNKNDYEPDLIDWPNWLGAQRLLTKIKH
ncbi:unnamed protein product [Blepharisma stoltei]|uniref:Uncharacterized protein n=1 Tax=Blepharisma stoltei TaxID=1481888 RepID=A0AAU9KLF2_9CILI|nr:unnamed protein product [Blepharisma stoltei]